MKKSFIAAVLIFSILLAAGCRGQTSAYTKYSYEFLGTFDTVIQVMGYAHSQAEFDGWAKKAEERFIVLNKLYDMYHDYESVSNIKTINDNAGIRPVAVAPEIIGLLQFSKDWQAKSPGVVNVAMGAPLRLWHDYRAEGMANPAVAQLPPMDELQEAAQHTDINKVIIDEQAGTVYLGDPAMSLDVGSIAKGYATELVAQALIKEGWASFIINSGGNVRTVGKPLDGKRQKWGVGITDPNNPGSATNAGEMLDTAFVAGLSVTTAGDYQRYYVVDGKAYHHIIDPATLMPADNIRAVTVVAEDSAVADFVDTVLFILPYEQGLEYVNGLDGVEALWVFQDGSMQATGGMKALLKKMGGATSQ